MNDEKRPIEEAREEAKLLKVYLRQNPCATEKDVRTAGYWTALDVLYGGDIERAAADLLPFFRHMERMLTHIAVGEATF